MNFFICSDRKTEALVDLKEELEHLRGTLQQVHQDKKELAEDAKLARVYRDEIETLKVQSAKVEKLEADVVKYRQKAEDTEYLKKRIAVSLNTIPLSFSFFVPHSLSLSLSLSLFIPPSPLLSLSFCMVRLVSVYMFYKCTTPGLEAAEWADVGDQVPPWTESWQPPVSLWRSRRAPRDPCLHEGSDGKPHSGEGSGHGEDWGAAGTQYSDGARVEALVSRLTAHVVLV